MIKPLVGGTMETAVGMLLPFEAWRASRYHAMDVKGDLRGATITRIRTAVGEDDFVLDIGPESRRSIYEVQRFYPDCMSDFPINKTFDCYVVLI
jgi:hypothetical protein